MNRLKTYAMVAAGCVAITAVVLAAENPDGAPEVAPPAPVVAQPSTDSKASATKSTKDYSTIAKRNAFELRDPPVVQPPPPPPPEKPAANVKLAGLMSVNAQKKALFRLEEQGGKAKTVSLFEGQMEEGLEVMAIDLKAGEVKIKNGGQVTLVSFKTHGMTNRSVASPIQPRPGQPPAMSGIPASAGAPVAASSGFPAPPPPGANPTTSSGRPTVVLPGSTPTSTTTTPSGSTLRQIPSRTLRVAPTTPQAGHTGPSSPNIDPVEQAVLMIVNEQKQKESGEDFPPFPPIPQ